MRDQAFDDPIDEEESKQVEPENDQSQPRRRRKAGLLAQMRLQFPNSD
eukprot:CAMPEP_0168315400 /NCGR_PEP_ID=MMETSP0210-20121227/11134_1 /TAXON_ID=40633 /ORGANISM="Condylostoma magnum, Strain COL2" /LENGTH=47 /DNA_ID= /DNA_START= /DNA_END= /DNA_ORIENTATION=